MTTSHTKKVYSGSDDEAMKKLPTLVSTPFSDKPSPLPPKSAVNKFSARMFGTWTLLSSITRLYAAYNIDNSALYQLCFGTFMIAWAHFVSEWLYFGTARLGTGLMFPLCISTGSMIWMLNQWTFYI
jgi:hypothetical protein